jgi:hypothetical protein
LGVADVRKRFANCARMKNWVWLWLDSPFPAGICSHERESTIFSPLGAYIAQAGWATSAVGIEFMESPPKTLKATLEAISRHAGECVKSDRRATGGTFNAVEVQRLPIHKAFHQARYVGSGWPMPAMQGHDV